MEHGRMPKKSARPPGKPTAPALSAAAAGESSGAPRWTFLSNHAHVLILLAREPSLVLREVAGRIGITERAVQRIVAELEEAGFLEIEKVGRQNRYRIHGERPLRHPVEAHRTIGDLLDVVNPDT